MGCGLTKSLQKSPIESKSQSTKILTFPDSSNTQTKTIISKGYIIIELLPTNGPCKIILASHQLSGEKRIIKVIRKKSLHKSQLGPDKNPIESNILSHFRHRNIVMLLEVFQDKDNFYETFEYCEGGNLHTKLNIIGPLLEADVAKVIFQILSALEYMHAHSFLHRNLKIENILLKNDYDLDIKLCNFSRATKSIKASVPVVFCGLSEALSPEVQQGKYTEKSDIWSCGLIAYRLLTGKSIEIKPRPTSKNLQPVNIELFADSSSMVIDFIKGLLETSCDERFSAQEALAHPWIVVYKNKSSYLTLPKPVAVGPNNKLVRGLILLVITCLIGKETLSYLGEKFKIMRHTLPTPSGRQEFEDIIKRTITVNETRDLASKMFENFSFDRLSRVDLTEFLISFADTSLILTEENISKAFDYIDTNSDKLISISDLESNIGVLDFEDEENRRVKEIFEGDKKISKQVLIDLVRELI
ncbi:hypothetical protein SteCoe_32888 [Stentor coeruleus]|uniref:Uncharacterized protein n=1 Tax=Stentor coeruleus TaxID=5963 RepID=A0A1R2AXZ1_9CILI|nr:hypothetical protein SteCoe_32888 [Stentor coeruleus]